MTTRIYVRVSTSQQTHRSQTADLKRWAPDDAKWYRDKATGTNMVRPGWQKLMREVQPGDRIVVWRLDRLGRTTRELATLFAELQERGITLLSIREGIDLGTPAGRMMAHMLASVAQYETEVRSERQRAGIQAARDAGKTWGGRQPGTRVRLTEDKERTIHRLYAAGESISAIARAVGLSRPTIYAALDR